MTPWIFKIVGIEFKLRLWPGLCHKDVACIGLFPSMATIPLKERSIVEEEARQQAILFLVATINILIEEDADQIPPELLEVESIGITPSRATTIWIAAPAGYNFPKIPLES